MGTPEHPNPQNNHSGHEHDYANRMDRPSPMNMLWGFILTMLTFLLVVICVLSIYWIVKISAPDTPDDNSDNPPIDNPDNNPQGNQNNNPPSMLAGATGAQWSAKDAGATLTFVSSAAIEDFENVYVNDAVIDRTCYDLSAGSTIVTLRANYLATLPIGTHKLTIQSKSGSAEATFEILDANTSTGQPSDETKKSFIMSKTEATVQIDKKIGDNLLGVYSDYAILVDLSTNSILAERNADMRIYPASMTKVLTLLVACENLSAADLSRYVHMSADILNKMKDEYASGFDFLAGEELQIRDLLYAIALESDCAASVQLAVEMFGSEAAFVQKMNEKCRAMGLVNSNFTNVSGLHDLNHYTTCREMASIMAAAMANEQVKTLLSAETYSTSTNMRSVMFRHTYFYNLIGHFGGYQHQPSNGKIVAAKTGKTPEAGCCLATYMESYYGNRYVVITASASTQYAYVEDYLYIYQRYSK